MSRRAPAVSAHSGWMRRPFCRLGGDAERADQRVVAESDCYPGTSATAGRRVAGTRSWASRSAVASTNRGTPRTSTSSAQPARRRSRRVRARPGPARGDPREHARDDALGEQVGRCSVVQDSRMTSRARWSSPVGEVRTRGGAPTRGGRRGDRAGLAAVPVHSAISVVCVLRRREGIIRQRPRLVPPCRRGGCRRRDSCRVA